MTQVVMPELPPVAQGFIFFSGSGRVDATARP